LCGVASGFIRSKHCTHASGDVLGLNDPGVEDVPPTDASAGAEQASPMMAGSDVGFGYHSDDWGYSGYINQCPM
jgi:hypothetical protein